MKYCEASLTTGKRSLKVEAQKTGTSNNIQYLSTDLKFVQKKQFYVQDCKEECKLFKGKIIEEVKIKGLTLTRLWKMVKKYSLHWDFTSERRESCAVTPKSPMTETQNGGPQLLHQTSKFLTTSQTSVKPTLVLLMTVKNSISLCCYGCAFSASLIWMVSNILISTAIRNHIEHLYYPYQPRRQHNHRK